MNKQYKKIFSVLFAILIGAGVIFFAWRGGNADETEVSTSGENGDWKDSLNVVPQAYQSKTLGFTKGEIETATADATTTTDVVARRLLLEYTASQARSTTAEMSDADAQSIATSLVGEVKLPQKKVYSLSDLNISTDNSMEADTLYVKTLSYIIKEFVDTGKNETELTILATAVDTQNSSIISKLDEKIIIYEDLIKNLLIIRTPSLVAPLHLRLLQSYETLRSSTVGLKSMLTDPVVGIASLAEYREGFDSLFLVEQEYRAFDYAN